MKNRTEEILKEICHEAQWGDLIKVSPSKLAHFLASLEARVEAVEGRLTIPQLGRVDAAPKEPASWEERFDEKFLAYKSENLRKAQYWETPVKIKAFIAEEKLKSFEDGYKSVLEKINRDYLDLP